jgi:hypothetical protein
VDALRFIGQFAIQPEHQLPTLPRTLLRCASVAFVFLAAACGTSSSNASPNNGTVPTVSSTTPGDVAARATMNGRALSQTQVVLQQATIAQP